MKGRAFGIRVWNRGVEWVDAIVPTRYPICIAIYWNESLESSEIFSCCSIVIIQTNEKLSLKTRLICSESPASISTIVAICQRCGASSHINSVQ